MKVVMLGADRSVKGGVSAVVNNLDSISVLT